MVVLQGKVTMLLSLGTASRGRRETGDSAHVHGETVGLDAKL